MNWLYWAPLAAASLHIVEEFVYPGGFAAWDRSYRPELSRTITGRFHLTINGLLLVACYDVWALRSGTMGGPLWLTVMALLFANAVWHLVGSVKSRTYSPGVVTGLMLYVPLTVYGYARFLRTGQVSVPTALLACAVGGLTICGWVRRFINGEPGERPRNLTSSRSTRSLRSARSHARPMWRVRQQSNFGKRNGSTDMVTSSCRAVGLALLIAAVAPVVGQGPQIRVTLLGTGCPPPVVTRFGPSTLVEAGEQKFLFDAGRGALQRLTQVAVRWQDVQGVFLTHLHSDHVVGFPDLWLTGWLIVPGRNVPLQVWGPRGTTDMMSHLRQAYEYDVRIRIQNDGASPEGAALLAKDISEGVVYEKSGVKITAFEVDHAPVKPAFGYRIDYAGHSVVLSGDTRVSENLVRHAQGVDLLVHEVFAPATLQRAGVPPARAKNIVDYHTTPEQAGEVFARVKPKLAVYSHICMPAATEEDLLPATRSTYAGPLQFGEDLMVIDVAETIDVRKPARSSP